MGNLNEEICLNRANGYQKIMWLKWESHVKGSILFILICYLPILIQTKRRFNPFLSSLFCLKSAQELVYLVGWWYYNHIKSTHMSTVPENAGAAFFGFMGVSLALVLASSSFLNQTSEQHTEQPRQEQESAVFRFGVLESSWSHSSPWSWPVFSVYTAWSWLSSSVSAVSIPSSSQKHNRLHPTPRLFSHGLGNCVRIQLRGNGCMI